MLKSLLVDMVQKAHFTFVMQSLHAQVEEILRAYLKTLCS